MGEYSTISSFINRKKRIFSTVFMCNINHQQVNKMFLFPGVVGLMFFLYLLLSHYLTYFTGIETKTENVLYHFKLISISCLDISHSYVFILCHCCLLSWRRYLDTTVSKKSSTHYFISAQEILNPIVNLFIISLFTMRSFFTGCHQSPI